MIVGAAPMARPARVQVTTPPASPQVHPTPAAATKLVPAGRVSVTVTVAGSWLGPELDTVIV